MTAATLFIRADASPTIGAGHVMRMAALASAWRRADLGPVRWSGTIAIPFVADHLDRLGFTNEGLGARVGEGEVLALDSYDVVLREACARTAQASVRLLADDGNGAVPPGFDLVWWPAPFGDSQRYSNHDCDVLTGPGAVPVREGLPGWSPDGGDRTAVTLGGGQPPEGLAAALRLLGDRVGRQGFMATGDWAPKSWQRIEADAVWPDISRCERLIVAGGVSALEAAAVGIPVVVVAFADNQQPTAAWARASGVPTIDVPRYRDEAELVRALELALPRARLLPPLTDGSFRVARHVAELARRIAA